MVVSTDDPEEPELVGIMICTSRSILLACLQHRRFQCTDILSAGALIDDLDLPTIILNCECRPFMG